MPEPASVLPVILVSLAKIAAVCFLLLTAAAYLVLLERWIAAWVQDRLGPNRVGIPLTKIHLFGLGQPLADGLKMIFKEQYTPAHVDKFLFVLAPIIILTAALAIFAVIPFGSLLACLSLAGAPGSSALIVAPRFDVGMVYVFALSSIAVYGVILGGWASNNKYSFLGGLRSSAQLIAYEIPMGLGILGVVLVSGSLRLDDIISRQVGGAWNFFTQPLGFIVFVIAAFAEAARLPFDLPEAEQELIGGYHTEYAAMKLLLFLIAEFLHMVTAAFLIVILFFGGWDFWGMQTSSFVDWPDGVLHVVVLMAKVFLVILFFMLVRWSWPRFRFDQLMSLAWKVMLPLGLVNLVAVAIIAEYGDRLAIPLGASRFGDYLVTHLHVSAKTMVAALIGWAALLLSWVAVAFAAPLHDDNRPRLEMHAFDEEKELRDNT